MKDSEFIFSLELLANDSSAVNSKLIKAMFFFVLLRNPALIFSAVTLKKKLGIVGSCRAHHFSRDVPNFLKTVASSAQHKVCVSLLTNRVPVGTYIPALPRTRAFHQKSKLHKILSGDDSIGPNEHISEFVGSEHVF